MKSNTPSNVRRTDRQLGRLSKCSEDDDKLTQADSMNETRTQKMLQVQQPDRQTLYKIAATTTTTTK